MMGNFFVVTSYQLWEDSATQTANLGWLSILNLTAEGVKRKLAQREKKGLFSANVLT